MLPQTRSLTLGARVGAPTVREGLLPTAQYHTVGDLAGRYFEKKSSMSYGLRIYGAGGARFLEYVVEDCERPLRGLLPGEVRRAL